MSDGPRSLSAELRAAGADARSVTAAGEVAAISQRLERLGHELLRVKFGAGDAELIAAASSARAVQARLALLAYGAEDLAGAERAVLCFLGFAPPQRASGDVGRPLAADPRYRRLAPAVMAARVRAITSGLRTAAPDCCAAITRLAAADPTGFAAIALPAEHETSLASEAKESTGAADRWLLSPLDSSLGFVPCSYSCIAAQQARRTTLAGRDLAALRSMLAVRLLRLAPGIELLVTGAITRRGGVRVEGIYALWGALPAPLVHLVEALVVRRLLAGAELRVSPIPDLGGSEIEVRQGLVFVKMLHCTSARWLDLA